MFSQQSEGSWDDVMRLIGQAHTLVHENGVARVQTDIRAGTRYVFLLIHSLYVAYLALHPNSLLSLYHMLSIQAHQSKFHNSRPNTPTSCQSDRSNKTYLPIHPKSTTLSSLTLTNKQSHRTDKKQHFSEKVSKVESILAADDNSPPQSQPQPQRTASSQADTESKKKEQPQQSSSAAAASPQTSAAGAASAGTTAAAPGANKATWASMFKK